MDTINIVLCGLGGQGILFMTKVLAQAGLDKGFRVMGAETHGMAQRGGCVTSHVRYGQAVHSPLAKKNDIDILVSFEKMETLRYLDYVKESGTVIINTEEIYPPAVNLGDVPYPKNVCEEVRRFFLSVKSVNAAALAIRAGNIRTVNMVLLGALSGCLHLSPELWEKIIDDSFPFKLIAVNRKAFHLGRGL